MNALTDTLGLSGVLAVIDDVRGQLTVPTVVNGLDHETFLLHDWDFTAGLEDRVQRSMATLGGDCSRDENGLYFFSHKDYVDLDITYEYNRTYEIDLGEMNRRANSDQHGRLFMLTPDSGFVYRKDGRWGYYGNGSWYLTNITDPNYFANQTLTIYIDPNGYPKIYLGGEFIMAPEIAIGKQSHIMLGSVNWQSFFIMRITGFREYYGKRINEIGVETMKTFPCYDALGILITELYQWDTNQTLTVKDMASLSPTPTFQITKTCKGTVDNIESTISGNDLIVAIPNDLLLTPGILYVYMCIQDADTHKETIMSSCIPVIARVEPSDEIYEEI